jgi:UDP-N-acetylmuramoyl-L-alanyl-D-glutamate--2,6-diaminopimelate ligase
MKFADLVSALDPDAAPTGPFPDGDVTDVAYDSRAVQPGAVFVAVRGYHSDGHQFISQAKERGAQAVIAEIERSSDASLAWVRVPDSRKALALLSARFFGDPSKRVKVVGITGTKGKTTTSFIVKSIVEAAGEAAGLIGTIEYRIGSRAYPAPNTTPESRDLQALLAEMAAAGVAYCVMEVSSHALALHRTDACTFRAAAFTNLAHDHLDFHETEDRYYDAKKSLFTGLGNDAVAVVNADDSRANELRGSTPASVITTGLRTDADVHPKGSVRHTIEGLSFTAATPAGEVEIRSSLVGMHNVSNLLTAIGLGIGLGFPLRAIADGIRSMHAVPGRMEKVDEGQDFGVLVDYAHTEASLVALLSAVREIASNRVITVFGCGGDRDRTKRPRMGAAALAESDVVIVTSDNPRTEDALAIISEIEVGMTSGIRTALTDDAQRSGAKTPYQIIPDRHEAIRCAIRMARRGDVVVLAGKGHEQYQIVGEKKLPFDDREAAREALRTIKTGKQAGS